MQLRIGVVLTIFFSFLQPVSAQHTYHHGMLWGRLVLSDKITAKSRWEFFLQKRTQNIPGEKSPIEAHYVTSAWFWLNFMLGRDLKLSVSPFGYFQTNTFLTLPADAELPGVKEYRWAARLEHERKLKWFSFINRIGLDYRRRDIRFNDVYVPNWRARYMARLEKPVPGIFSKVKPVTFILSDEVMFQFGEAVRNNANAFDQNRISAGFSYDIFRNVKTTCSYMNIIQQRPNGKDFDIANALWLVLTFDNLFSQFRK